MLRDRLVFSLIGTPLQRPAEKLRTLIARWKHPGRPPEIRLEGERMSEVMKAAIVDGMNCVDVGCHLGSVLNEILRLSPRGHHIAVEPLAYKAAWLRRKYPQVQIHQVALGDRNGTIEFQWNPRRSGFSSLKGPNDGTGHPSFEVEIKRLDDLIPSNRSIGFMKVDVEGAELYVLQGARRVLAGSRPLLLFECTRSGMSRFGITSAQMFEFVTKELNYCIFLLKEWLAHGQPLELAEFDRAMTYPFQAFNFVAVPRSVDCSGPSPA